MISTYQSWHPYLQIYFTAQNWIDGTQHFDTARLFKGHDRYITGIKEALSLPIQDKGALTALGGKR